MGVTMWLYLGCWSGCGRWALCRWVVGAVETVRTVVRTAGLVLGMVVERWLGPVCLNVLLLCAGKGSFIHLACL